MLRMKYKKNCIKVLSEYHCTICLPFKPIYIHFREKKSLQNNQKIIWNKVFHKQLNE